MLNLVVVDSNSTKKQYKPKNLYGAEGTVAEYRSQCCGQTADVYARGLRASKNRNEIGAKS